MTASGTEKTVWSLTDTARRPRSAAARVSVARNENVYGFPPSSMGGEVHCRRVPPREGADVGHGNRRMNYELT